MHFATRVNYGSAISLALQAAAVSALSYFPYLFYEISNSVSSTAGLGFVFGPFFAVGIAFYTFVISWPIFIFLLKTSLGKSKLILIFFQSLIILIAVAIATLIKY